MMLRYLEGKESLEPHHKRRGDAYLPGAESRRGSHFPFRLIRLARLPSRDREAGGCFGIWVMCLTKRRGLESSKLPLGGGGMVWGLVSYNLVAAMRLGGI